MVPEASQKDVTLPDVKQPPRGGLQQPRNDPFGCTAQMVHPVTNGPSSEGCSGERLPHSHTQANWFRVRVRCSPGVYVLTYVCTYLPTCVRTCTAPRIALSAVPAHCARPVGGRASRYICVRYPTIPNLLRRSAGVIASSLRTTFRYDRGSGGGDDSRSSHPIPSIRMPSPPPCRVGMSCGPLGFLYLLQGCAVHFSVPATPPPT
jgi:hypothetical protein